MKEENWISSILETPQYIQEVDPNPNLIKRFRLNLNSELTYYSNQNTINFKWAIAAMILILLNFSAMIYFSKHDDEKRISSQKNQSNQFDNTTTYNY